ncbi:hypothetical protein, partial [Siminovitchia fortis]|uniref:hypothetical protein n=1 Tax=Siminovitchia fortis TaxID=254758 RepID=UPI001643138D
GRGSCIKEEGKIKEVKVFLEGWEEGKNRKRLKVGGNEKIYGCLYGEEGNIEFGGGGGFEGNLLSGGKSVKVWGGWRRRSAVVFGAEGKVEMWEGGMVRGGVIAEWLDMKGGA